MALVLLGPNGHHALYQLTLLQRRTLEGQRQLREPLERWCPVWQQGTML